ncbi:MAG: GNAT family N-acetyltransferase [Pseudomonadota bacterium]
MISGTENEDSLTNVEVKTMTIDHLTAVVSLHCRIHYNWFITHIGKRFLTRFYREFIGRPGNCGAVAFCSGKAAGFVVGTANLSRFYRDFYRHNLCPLALLLMQRVVVNAFVRQEIFKRLAHLKFAFRSLFDPGPKKVASKTDTSAPFAASLIAIGVIPEFQRKGIGDKLLRCFCEELQKKGADAVGVRTTPGNYKAVAFYEKNGWKREGNTKTEAYFLTRLRRRDL